MASIGFFIKEDDSIHRMTTDFHSNILIGREKIKEFATKKVKYACLLFDSYNRLQHEEYEYVVFKEDGYINAPSTHKTTLSKLYSTPMPGLEKAQLKITIEKLKKINEWVPNKKIKKELMMQAIGGKNSIFINN